MQSLVVPSNTNYIAAFLSFSCTLRCPYCINHHGGDLVKGRRMSGEDWVAGINRLNLPPDLPVTLQGGEPTVHKDFYQIVAGIKPSLNIDMLTNLEFDVEEFAAKVPPERMKRDAPYASIRVSYHRGQSDFKKQLEKGLYLVKRGYSVGFWAVDSPEYPLETREAQREAQSLGIDFRLKEFLGPWKGVEYGTVRYNDSVNSRYLSYCECRTSEVLLAPDGKVYRCHSDLYAARLPIGHITDGSLPLVGTWVPCAVFGKCNTCDTKIKTDRHQRGNHSSVTIRHVSPPYADNKDYVKEVVNTYGKQDQIPQNIPQS